MDTDSKAGPGFARWKSWLQRDRIVPKTQQLPSSSRRLYLIDHYSSLPMIAPIVGLLLTGAIVLGAVLRFPSGWIAAFEVGTSFVTVMMVLVIQHTQGREQTATQRKLDELLRALPEAESRLMMLEEAPDDIMRSVERDQRESKEMATNDGRGGPYPERTTRISRGPMTDPGGRRFRGGNQGVGLGEEEGVRVPPDYKP